MITLDPHSAVLPFEQIRSQIADLIRSGRMDAGQRLPSVRQLAADLAVAPGTVGKAYGLLESEGLVVSSRARGTQVAAGQSLPAPVRDAAVTFVAAVRGVDLEQAIGAVRAAWATKA